MYSNKSVISGYIDLEEEKKELFDISNLYDQCPYCYSSQYKTLFRIKKENTMVKCKECGTKYRINYNRKFVDCSNLFKEIWRDEE